MPFPLHTAGGVCWGVRDGSIALAPSPSLAQHGAGSSCSPREGSRTPLQPPTVPFCFVRCLHTSAPRKAAGGVVLLPTPFLCSKSKSLFLRSSGCQPAVRQPDGKARGLSSLPGSLAAGGPSASRGLPLELCQALGAHCYGLELSSAAYAWPVVLQPCPGARCWVEGLSSCPPPPSSSTCGVTGCSLQPGAWLSPSARVPSLSWRRWGAGRGGEGAAVSLFASSRAANGQERCLLPAPDASHSPALSSWFRLLGGQERGLSC